MEKENIIRFSSEDFNALTAHLAQAGEDESLIYGLFSTAKTNDSTLYICSRLIIPDEKDLIGQSRISIEPSRQYQAVIYELAYELEKSVIDIHTHPFTTKARFSSIDDRHGTINAKYIAEKFPETTAMGMVVLGKGFDNFEARIWNRDAKCFEPANRIEILGSPTMILQNNCENHIAAENDIYARHKIIPGWKQGLLEDLKVFVAGLGGNGALIFDSLLSLGIGKHSGWIKACDPDVLEASNLPRIPYAFPKKIGSSKAKLAQQHANKKAPNINVVCYKKGLEAKEVQECIKEANIIFGAIDNDAARIILNSQAAKYAIPYIDLGTEIIPQDSVYEAAGQVHVFVPGKTACLVCTGAIDPSKAALDAMGKKDITEYVRAGYVRGTSETPMPSVLHLNGVVSHIAISQFLKMIFADNFDGQDYVHYNRQKTMLLAASSVRDDQCPVCGHHGYIGDGDDNGIVPQMLSNLVDKSAFKTAKKTSKTRTKKNGKENKNGPYRKPANHSNPSDACGNGCDTFSNRAKNRA